MGYPDGDEFDQLPTLPEAEMVLETFSSKDYDFETRIIPEPTSNDDD